MKRFDAPPSTQRRPRTAARTRAIATLLLIATALVLAGGEVLAATAPALHVSPSQGLAGSTVTISGSDFPRQRPGDIVFDGSDVGKFKADTDGSFAVDVAIPDGADPGSHTIAAVTRNDAEQASVAFVVLAPTTAPPTTKPTTGPTTPPTSAPSKATSTPTSDPTAAPTATSRATATATSPGDGTVPAFKHVWWIVMENKEYGSIVGATGAPYLNSLISQFGLATAYDAVTHPSEPNYIAMFSGSTHGITDDGVHNIDGNNLADQIEAGGRTWSVFAENVPTNCYMGATASGGADGSGTYARKHEPAISFTSISGNAARCARITDLSHFSPSAADFELIVPNLCNDMHDCSIATGDSWLASFVPRIIGSAAFANSALFITWDEGSTDTGGGGHVATLVVSPLVTPATRSSVAHDHYSLLRTVEDAWGLPCLGASCSANDLGEFFGTVPPAAAATRDQPDALPMISLVLAVAIVVFLGLMRAILARPRARR